MSCNKSSETCYQVPIFCSLKMFLTQYMPLVSFYTPWKHQKTKGFLMFPGVIERHQWHEMGYGAFLHILF